MRQPSEPIFNVPPVIIATVAALTLMHALRVWLLQPATDRWLILSLAFIPARYDPASVAYGVLPGGFGAEVWSFATYALIHADLAHLGLNMIWLMPFGTALARRFGTGRFLLFTLVTAAAGAFAHLAVHFGELYPMIGASAAISGTMAAAMRFAFQSGGPLSGWNLQDDGAYRVPAASLAGTFRDPRILAFILVWFGINALFGLGGFPFGNGRAVAWEAHIGGFVAGLLLFSIFDPVGRHMRGRAG